MFEKITKVLKDKNILFHQNVGITIATVPGLHEGYVLAKDIFYAISDLKTVLYLSGGNTPKELYKKFAEEEQLVCGAVGMIDERFGPKFHAKSNEKMIQETGLIRYLQMRDIPFYPILQNQDRVKTASRYDDKIRSLNSTFQKSIALLGIGVDGHTSSLAPNRSDFQNPMFDTSQKNLLVSEFDDPKSAYGERVGMTFLGLSLLDVMIVLAFGKDKQKTLELVFAEGKEEEIPARFFKREDVAKKTLFITDQRI